MSKAADPASINELVSLGYSVEQATDALEQHEGNIDDSIDYLFTKGRSASKGKKGTAGTAPWSIDDVTVTDSIRTRPVHNDNVTVTDSSVAPTAAAPAATPAFALLASGHGSMRGKAHTASSHHTKSAVFGNPTTLSHPTPPLSYAPLATKDNKDEKPVCKTNTDSLKKTENKLLANKIHFDIDSESENSSSSMAGGSTNIQPAAIAPRSTVGPGAFAVGNPDDLITMAVTESSYQPSLRHVEAELVDPDQENQVLEHRLQQELERERGRVKVAHVVPQSEIARRRRRVLALMVGIVLVLVAIAVAVSLTVGQPHIIPPSAPTAAPTFAPPPEDIVALIAPISFDNGTSLFDSSSPQSAAARWLAGNANLTNYTDQRKIQRYALATLYYSTNGDKWWDSDSWLSNVNECDWWSTLKSICDDSNALTVLYLEKNNLLGTVPDEIAFLSDSLFRLELNENEIQGTLPSTLGLMTSLKDLTLRANNITSTIPTTLALLTELEDMLLYENRLSGSIPTEIALMTSLKDLRLHDNDLNGTIDGTSIGALTNLDTLRLGENKFTSTIPTEIALLTVLEEFMVERNALIGTLPTEIGLMTSLKQVFTQHNFLTGHIPTEVGSLTAVEKFRTSNSNLTGPIPSEIALMTSLKRLRLGSNNLTGTILPSLGFLPALNRLELKENLLTGSIPTSLGLLTLLSDLRLHANNLTGTILSEFMQFTELKGLILYNNSFTGSLPAFGNLTKLKYFEVYSNMLTGSIPDSIAGLTSLERIMLSNNGLTGTIPEAIFSFSNLQTVYLFNNSLTGNSTCPPHIVNCYLSCFVEGDDSCRVL